MWNGPRDETRRRGGRVALRVWGGRLGFDRSDDDAGRIDTEEVKVAKPRCHVDIGCVSTLHGARRRSLALALSMLNLLHMMWFYIIWLLYWTMTKGEGEKGVGWGRWGAT